MQFQHLFIDHVSDLDRKWEQLDRRSVISVSSKSMRRWYMNTHSVEEGEFMAAHSDQSALVIWDADKISASSDSILTDQEAALLARQETMLLYCFATAKEIYVLLILKVMLASDGSRLERCPEKEPMWASRLAVCLGFLCKFLAQTLSSK